MPSSVASTQFEVDDASIGHVPPGKYVRSLALLSTLFFIWGFITVINNTLLPHLKSVFNLDYFHTTLIESTWFIAYFVASLPAAKIIEKIGYKKSMVSALLVMAMGALLVIPSVRIPSYWAVVASLFIIASGIALLQVAANPYVSVLGPAESASSRLNLTQAFNSMGTTLAPLFGGYLILSRSTGGNAQNGAAAMTMAERMLDARVVQLPYLIVAAVVVLLAIAIAVAKLPSFGQTARRVAAEERKNHSLWRHRNLVFGIPAIFLYVLAEISVSNLFILFITRPEIGNMSQAQAYPYLFLLWGGMMVGRFVGSFVMRSIAPNKVLAAASIAAFVVMTVTLLTTGHVAMWALISVGLFHSIMFPTIFTLGIKDLGPLTEEGSGLLIMAIAGGGVVLAQGWLADKIGLQHSFLVTVVCELYVLFYALWGSRTANVDTGTGAAAHAAH